ncbi:hypothetical protein [Proteus terrae]|uniref:hypothetical protein n=1 Tax=Proteus terrae TaxID=1574161 RepID=UPI001CC09B0E|nr:hypothetical protein [Proteus terrae]UAX03313.1 hypothetical protein KDN45_08170 [Proteus terrae subsp. cibarius]
MTNNPKTSCVFLNCAKKALDSEDVEPCNEGKQISIKTNTTNENSPITINAPRQPRYSPIKTPIGLHTINVTANAKYLAGLIVGYNPNALNNIGTSRLST